MDNRVIITGACGFIGSCLTERLLQAGNQVIGMDNLSRAGSEINAQTLSADKDFLLYRLDLSHETKTDQLFSQIGAVDAVFHLAAQVAVTASYQSPRKDFLDNALATFNVIESVRKYSPDAYALYASTNKVYGQLVGHDEPVGLQAQLNPYTPYGVSKATGELYFTEYGTTELGLDTCSLRQSCIYGHHQYGVEDQGWMAWFSIANLLGLPITLYGDGNQVRDLLFVDDLVDLYLKCWQNRIKGAFPVGGGQDNQISLKEGLDLIEKVTGKAFSSTHSNSVRPGDQSYFVADNSWTTQRDLAWKPKVSVTQGVPLMVEWIREHLTDIECVLAARH